MNLLVTNNEHCANVKSPKTVCSYLLRLVGLLIVLGFAPGIAQAIPLSSIPLIATDGTSLVTFNSSTPGTVTGPVLVTGLQPLETLIGIDYRPATGQLYGVGSTGRLYTINPTTGVATQVGSSAAFTPSGTSFGTDFNPQADRLRVVSNDEQNVRLNPDTGALAGTDTALNPAGNVVAIAYDRNDTDTGTATTLFGIDSVSGNLVRIGSVNGTPSSPNNGVVTDIGSLGLTTPLDERIGFDIAPPVIGGIAFATITSAPNQSELYTINLNTGGATLVGTIGTGTTSYSGLAVVIGHNFTVNTNADASDTDTTDGVCDSDAATVGDQCTLRAAIEQANADPGSNNINFAPAVTGIITLTLGELGITSADGININGPGARVLTVSGNNASRVFNITTASVATISGLTISNGRAQPSTFTGPTVVGGGGILNNGTLTLTDVTVSGNVAVGFEEFIAIARNASGGGIYNNGTLTVNRSTISGNSATGANSAPCTEFLTCLIVGHSPAGYGEGGGIENVGSASIYNSTISGNTAKGGNGISGIVSEPPSFAQGGGVSNRKAAISLLISSTTISNNTATAGSTSGSPPVIFGSGGGVINHPLAVPATVNNTIIAGNKVGPTPEPGSPVLLTPDVSGDFASGGFISGIFEPFGYNLIGNADGSTGFSTVSSDQFGTGAAPLNPKIGPLANNGGPTDTHRLLLTSPAIDMGKDYNGPDVTDQRGKPRTVDFDPTVGPAPPTGDETDIGSFELQALNQPPVNTVPGPQTTNEDTPLVFSSGNGNQISISDPDAGSNPVSVTLTATHGTLTLSTTTGLTFTTGDGTDDATMTFTGTISNINAALNGLTFKPTLNYNGAATITITTDDQGNTGDYGPLTDTDVVAITINPVNDAPVAVNDAYSTNEDTPLTVPAPGVLANDTDVDSTTLTAELVDYPSNGDVDLHPDGSFTYTPYEGFTGADTFTYRTFDGTDHSNVATVTITVNELPRLYINDVFVTEGNSGVNNAVFTVTLSFPSAVPVTVTVDFLTSDGTAQSPGDYQARTGTRTFAPFETVKTITVPVNGDTQMEPDETFFVVLADPINAKLGDGVGQGTIIDDDTPRVSFDSGFYSVSEGDGRFTITVTRTSALSVASIDYATSDDSGLNNCDQVTGNASQRCDYTIGVGTIHFAFGELSKTITIPVIDDVYADGDEIFFLTLSNPVGLNIEFPTAALQITDNDSIPGAPNPIDTTDFFIRQLYLDFLNREPDPPGFAAWTQQLNNCPAGDTSCDRLAIAGGFYLSPEFRERVYFIYKFYQVSFGDFPDYDEFMNDRARVSGFLNASELEQARLDFIANFMNRPKFHAFYDSTTPRQFVETLLSKAGVTLPNKEELIAQLQSGQKTRAEVLRAIVESAEVDSKFFNESTIVMHYFALLRRDPDALYQHWVDVFQQNGNFREVTNGFINSAEYRARFGQ